MIINHILIENRILILTLSFFTANMAFAADCPEIALDVSGAWSDGGYSYLIQGTRGIAADNQNSPSQSTLRLFENGVEMGPAHSLHDDIRNLGQGRFSHWSLPDGTGESLYFSTSDDTDPRTNGKSYSYCLNIAALRTTSSYHAPSPTSSLVVNIRDTGAKCDGVTDDTAAIQTAVNQVGGTGGTVLVPAGTCMVSSGVGRPYKAITLESNMTFKMDSGATIKLQPTSSGTYAVLYMENASNVNVVGGTIQGERHQHLAAGNFAGSSPATGGEWGMGIWIAASSNVYVEEVTVTQVWGDGFYLSGWPSASANINIFGVVADDNRRQGISIEHVDGLVVRDSVFRNTKGAWPMSGLDFEPFNTDHYVRNVKILNNQFINNYTGITYGSRGGTISNITIDGNTMKDNKYACIRKAGRATNQVITNNTCSGSQYTILNGS